MHIDGRIEGSVDREKEQRQEEEASVGRTRRDNFERTVDVRMRRSYGGGEGSLRKMSALEGGQATGEVERKAEGSHRDDC